MYPHKLKGIKADAQQPLRRKVIGRGLVNHIDAHELGKPLLQRGETPMDRMLLVRALETTTEAVEQHPAREALVGDG